MESSKAGDMPAHSFFLDHAFLPSGWARDVHVVVADGIITSVTAGARGGKATHVAGLAIPGLPNLHCHAFQRGMAGLAERRGPDAASLSAPRAGVQPFLRPL